MIRIDRARVVTMQPRKGDALGVISCATVVVRGDRFESVTETDPGDPPHKAEGTIDAAGRVLLPGFVDAHTHALWAGDRLDEWEFKRRGASYLEILRSGGGIMSTVRAVRRATAKELADALDERLAWMLSEGTTSLEIKSGYGLSTETELKMLRVIAEARGRFAGRIAPTALLGHALDPEVPAERFIRRTIDETLPAVHAEFPGIAIDAYCEEGAWPAEACAELFMKAASLGHPFRVHADQFNRLGMVRWAIDHRALSIDHLEASSEEDLRALATSETFAVLLPGTGFHTDGRYARGRPLIDAGGAERVVIATNLNPGSSPCRSMALAVGLAVRGNGLTPAEALASSTRNAARLLGLADAGRIEAGCRADAVLLRHRDERLLAHDIGGNPLDRVLCGGRWVR